MIDEEVTAKEIADGLMHAIEIAVQSQFRTYLKDSTLKFKYEEPARSIMKSEICEMIKDYAIDKCREQRELIVGKFIGENNVPTPNFN